MKGKYAARAAGRREAAEVEENEAAYRRRILKLTEERDAARAERDEARADWQKEVRILRAQLAEGTSPRVQALTRQLNKMRDERDHQSRAVREREVEHEVFGTRLAEHFAVVHGVRANSDEMYAVLAEFLPLHDRGLVFRRAGR